MSGPSPAELESGFAVVAIDALPAVVPLLSGKVNGSSFSLPLTAGVAAVAIASNETRRDGPVLDEEPTSPVVEGTGVSPGEADREGVAESTKRDSGPTSGRTREPETGVPGISASEIWGPVTNLQKFAMAGRRMTRISE